MLKAIQRNGYGDTLLNGPKSSWLGYSLLPEGTRNKKLLPAFLLPPHFQVPGSPVEFPLLFTENPNFDIRRYLGKDEATDAFWKN